MKPHRHIRTTVWACALTVALAGTSLGQEAEKRDSGSEPLPPGALARFRLRGEYAEAPVRGLAASSDGSQIAVFDPTSPTADVIILDGRTGEPSATIERPGKSVVQQVAFTPDGRFAAAGTTHRGLFVWNTANPSDRVMLNLRNPGRFVAAASSAAELDAEGEQTGEISVGPLIVAELGVFGRLKHWQATPPL